MKKYYYIDKRSAWDTVQIGLFENYESAKKSLNIGWDESLIKEATLKMIEKHLNNTKK
jgi:hypothetical protein